MKKFLPYIVLLVALQVCAGRRPNGANFEFSKSVFKVKGTIKKADSDYVIVATDDKTVKFIPAYLPEEYKKNGLEVAFDGELGKINNGLTTLNIHRIWVAYELKVKYKLAHKNYDLN